VVPEIVHTYLMDSHWKFQGGCLKGHGAKLEFSEGWEIQSKKPSVGEVWISSGTKQFDAKFLTLSQLIHSSWSATHWGLAEIFLNS